MNTNYKACILVIVVAIVVFAIGKPLFTRFMAPEDYARRRNLWLLLAATSFLAPNMWLYVLIAAPAIALTSERDRNPVALYLFVLLAVPPVELQIPTFGLVGKVFGMDHPRLLSIALLLPLAVKLRAHGSGLRGALPEPGLGPRSSLGAVDIALLAFVALQLILVIPYDTVTSLGRRVLLLMIDIVLPYFVVSRACRSRADIAEVMAAFVAGAVVLVPLGVFEFFRGWMLFAVIGEQWDAARLYFPLYRASFLRAQTTAGHSIFMGYFMAVALGMWLYLQGRVQPWGWRWLGMLTLLTGLVTALARGPWVGAAAIVVTYLFLGPNARIRALRGVAVIAAIIGLAVVSPWGDRITEFLPFIGSIDEQTVTYRQELALASWTLVQQNPFFGSFFFLANLEAFRTGEGIIDLVNTYAVVALTYGLVGVGLFISIFLAAIWKIYGLVRRLEYVDPDASLMGVVIIACIVGTLVVLATTSFLHTMPYFVWAFMGLAAAYIRLGTEEVPVAQPLTEYGEPVGQASR